MDNGIEEMESSSSSLTVPHDDTLVGNNDKKQEGYSEEQDEQSKPEIPRRRSLRIQNRKRTEDDLKIVYGNDDDDGETDEANTLPSQEEEKKDDDTIIVSSNNGEPLLNGQRRSRRDLNRIRLKGTAPTFYRRLQMLFFSSSQDIGYKTMCQKRMNITRPCSNPPIYVIDDFLTPFELDYFQSKITSMSFEKSFVDNMEFDKEDNNSNAASIGTKTGIKRRRRRTVVDTLHRTSTFFSFRKLHDSRISALESRVADLLGCWVHQIEAIQLVRYKTGEFFGVHHDMGDLLPSNEVTLPPKHLAVKRRLVTLFCYLNTLDEDYGGCTHFPECNNLRVRPVKGRAVLWSNVTADGMPDPRTIHAGEAVKVPTSKTSKKSPKNDKIDLSNEKTPVKYGLNIWICEE